MDQVLIGPLCEEGGGGVLPPVEQHHHGLGVALEQTGLDVDMILLLLDPFLLLHNLLLSSLHHTQYVSNPGPLLLLQVPAPGHLNSDNKKDDLPPSCPHRLLDLDSVGDH